MTLGIEMRVQLAGSNKTMKRWKIILLFAVAVSISAHVASSADPPSPPGVSAQQGIPRRQGQDLL